MTDCDHTYPPANRDGTCPSCGEPRAHVTVYAVALTSLHGKVVYDVGTNRGAFAAVEMAMQRWSQFGESTGDVIHIQAGVK